MAPPANLPVVEYAGTVCRCEHCGSDRLLARDHETSVRIDAAETIARLRQEVLDPGILGEGDVRTQVKQEALLVPERRGMPAVVGILVVDVSLDSIGPEAVRGAGAGHSATQYDDLFLQVATSVVVVCCGQPRAGPCNQARPQVAIDRRSGYL